MRLALLALFVSAGVAHAHPPPSLEPDPDPELPVFEWSTWLRGAYGYGEGPTGDVARATTPVRYATGTTWEGALGIDLTVGTPLVRVGGWAEARGLTVFGGGEIVLGHLPSKLDLFFYDGDGQVTVRAGSSNDAFTAALTWGYRAPWRLWGPWDGTTRYMIGARLVASVTRSYSDPRDWSATFGLEVEPVGTLRYLLGIRGWYH